MDRKTRIEENEKLFREVNERVEQIENRFGGESPQWVCECGDETCFEKLTVPLDEYHAVRARDNWFLIMPGHEKLDVEKIVDERGAYLVVEKLRL
jgi:23S rRNA A1618 N6-methylase RlmF